MKRKAQSTIEFVVLFGIIVAALIAMQVYIKRSAQGQLRNYTQQLSEESFYSPGATNSLYTAVTNILENTVGENKITNSSVNIDQGTNMTEEVLSFGDEPGRW